MTPAACLTCFARAWKLYCPAGVAPPRRRRTTCDSYRPAPGEEWAATRLFATALAAALSKYREDVGGRGPG